MDDRITAFLASARSCALSPMEHAEVRAELVAHTAKIAPAILLRESSDALQMTDYEKAIGKASLLRFMRANPLNEQGFAFVHWLLKPMTAVISSLSALLLVGGGMAYAAEGSMPGDLLYPVKVHITEPVISGLSLTSARRAQWNVRTIERRLEEADALSKEPDPNEQRAILRSQMEENVASLGEHLRDLSAEDKKTVRKNFLSELSQHRESLLQMQESGFPSGLNTLAEEAAADLRGSDGSDDEKENSSSIKERQDRNRREVKPAENRKPAILPPPDNEEDEQPETSSLSSSSESRSVSSFEERKIRIMPREIDDSR